jgi:hypothetical protein
MSDTTPIALIERLAARMGVSKHRINLDFRIYSEEDGGPSWSIYASIPQKDKRKVDRTLHAGGPTLDEAEIEMLETFRRMQERGEA